MHSEVSYGGGHRPLEVIVCGLPGDSHTWNLIFVQLVLEDLGHRVHNLGCCLPVAEVVAACAERRPDLLVVSSVNGHGTREALPVIEALRADQRTAGLPAVIGGKLDTCGGADHEGAQRLQAAGWDAVFAEEAGVDQFTTYLRGLERPAMTA